MPQLKASPEKFQYDAFLSYSHSGDGRLAPAIQLALQNLAKRWYQRRALRIFRDETNLAATPELFPAIRRALDGSRYFILLASPEAAKSHWVAREVDHWLSIRPPDTILIALTDGQLHWIDAGDTDNESLTALPVSLRQLLTVEPRYADLRWARSEEHLSLRHARFRAEILNLAAPLHGKDKDELDGEDVRQFHKTRRFLMIVAMTLILSFVLTAAAFIAERRSRRASDQQRLEAESRLLTLRARSILDDTRDALSAIPHATDAVQRTWRRGGYVLPEAITVLQDAVEAAPRLERVLVSDKSTSDLAWSPTEKEMTTIGNDGTARIWNLDFNSSREISTAVTLTGLNWSPTGDRLLGTHSDGSVTIWDATNARPIHRIPPQEDWGVDGPAKALWSSDGRHIVVVRRFARVWDAVGGRPVGPLLHDNVNVAVWSRNGQLLTGSADRTARIWTALGTTKHIRLPRRGDYGYDVWDAAWSPKGERVATVLNRLPIFEVTVWNSTTGGALHVLKGHTYDISSLAWSPDGDRLVTASGDGTARVWDPDTGVEVHTLRHRGAVSAVSWFPRGVLVLTADDQGFVSIWNAMRGTLVTRIAAQKGKGRLSPSGQQLATIGSDGGVYVWRLPSGGPLTDPELSTMAALSVDRDRVATVTAKTEIAMTFAVGQRIQIWNRATGRFLTELDANWFGVSALRWSPTGDRLFVAAGHHLGIWNSRTGHLEVEIEPEHDFITVVDAAWSPDGSQLVATVGHGNWNGTTVTNVVVDEAQILDSATGLRRSRLKAAAGRVAWSPGGLQIAAVGVDGVVRFWQKDSERQEMHLPSASPAGGAIAWSPGGDRLAVVHGDRRLRVWNTSDRTAFVELQGGQLAVDLQIAWSANGRLLAGTGSDQPLRVWDTANGTLIQEILGPSDGFASVTWAPEGSEVVVLRHDGGSRVFTLGVERLLTLAARNLTHRF